MYEALRDLAEVRIFTEGSALTLPQIEPTSRLKGFLANPLDILIYHWAAEWEPVKRLLKTECKIVIKYHNITPPHFLDPYCSDFAADCDRGRQELGSIARSHCDLFLSDSQYNKDELIAAGADESKSFVVPPFHHVDRLEKVGIGLPNGAGLANGNFTVCTVGRIAPNKAHADLIAAFAIYHYDYNPRSQLVLIGKQEPRLIKYTVMLHGVIRRLKLERSVIFADNVSDRELKAYYDAADVFAITSQHEGFCVPLVEAMAMRVPIVAYASTAVTETIGSAGLVWQARDPQLMAESINAIDTDQSLRKALIEAGRRRYEQHFANRRIAEQLIDTLGNFLDH